MLAVQNISTLAEDFNLACNLNASNARENGTVSDANDKWSPPHLGFVKVNIDAGCFNDSYTCWGLLCRDHQGNVQAAATKRERITCVESLILAAFLEK
jgi:hypothetical protein